MAYPSRYPKAVWKGDGMSGGSYTGGPWKVVLHTTETAGLPGYNNGRVAPHVTYLPKSREWVQHTSFLHACRALVNGPHPIQTNRDQALQVEIVCYSNRPLAAKSASRQWVGDLTESNLKDIQDFLIWANKEFGVQLYWPGVQAYSYAQANAPGFRMRPTAWDNWNGICGHQHVPDENTHWDPGALNWDFLLDIEEEQDDMAYLPIKHGDGSGDREFKKSDVASIQAMMNRAYGSGLKSDGIYGDKTKAAVAAAFGTNGSSVYGNLYDNLVWDLAVKAAKTVPATPGEPPTVDVQVDQPATEVKVYVNDVEQ